MGVQFHPEKSSTVGLQILQELRGAIKNAFVYEVTLTEESPQPYYTLAHQLIPAGTLVGTGQNIALLSDGKSEFHLRAPCRASWSNGSPQAEIRSIPMTPSLASSPKVLNAPSIP